MKVTTKGRYGIRAAFDLALHAGEGPIPLNAIATRQDISEPYLEQLMGALRRAGVVRSVRGVQGGYLLNDTPENVTVGQVLRALEGDMAVMQCTSEVDPLDCGQTHACVYRSVWVRMQKAVEQVMDTTTLADMLKDYQENCDCSTNGTACTL